MQRLFVVIDENGDVSWDAKKGVPQNFRTFKAAKKRAEELAACAAGETIRIFELTAETLVPLKPVQTSRKHPIEHYDA